MTHAFASSFCARLRAAKLVLVASALVAANLFAAVEDTAAASDGTVKLLVLDLEIIGDLSDPQLEHTHAERLRKVSEQLRSELARIQSDGTVASPESNETRGRMAYEIVDPAPAAAMIEKLRGTQYLHKCNGCEIDIALELGADQVLVAWIHRVSQLILSLTYEIREVPSGRPIRRKAFDFRGDNDKGWSRAVSYMARDLASARRD